MGAGREGGTFALQLALLSLLLLALAVLPGRGRPAGGEPIPFQQAEGLVRRHASRLGRTLLPGAHDLRFGSPIRGYVTLVAALLPVVTGLLLRLGPGIPRSPAIPAFGPITNFARSDLIWRMPLPDLGDGPLAEQHYWTFFWAYPHARAYWGLLAVSALAALVLHLHRLPAIWRR